jgi:hypothetical protein
VVQPTHVGQPDLSYSGEVVDVAGLLLTNLGQDFCNVSVQKQWSLHIHYTGTRIVSLANALDHETVGRQEEGQFHGTFATGRKR